MSELASPQPLEITEADIARAEAFKAEANALFAQNLLEEAIEKYTEAIGFNPTVAAYYTNRSISNFKLEFYQQALQDANAAIEVNPKFVKGYFRRASAHMALGQLKEAIKDFKAISTDPTAKVKLAWCQKEHRRIEFEKAIFVDQIQMSAVELLGNLDNMVVEASYDGPVLADDSVVTLPFIEHLMNHMKAKKLLHKKYACKLLLAAKEFFYSRPTIEDVHIPEGAKITVCGDIHGQFYDLLNIFSTNGIPSPENMYLFNGDFVDRGSFSVECILTLFAFKLLYPNSLYLSRGNHEADDMNRVYGFEGEVKAKYSEATFKLFSEIFNAIPLGNLIQNKILVIHGGLFSR